MTTHSNDEVVLTNPYPRLLPVCLSVMTTASSISPNLSKNSRSDLSVVWYGSPPTKIFVNVVSFCVIVLAIFVVC